MNRTVLNRLIRGVIAGGYAQGVSLAIQILSVPILVYSWGMVGYGEWLAISAIPVYMGMFDLGISNSAANLMAVETDRKDRMHIFKKGWVMISASYSVGLVFFVIVGLSIDWVEVFKFVEIDLESAQLSMVLLGVHVFFVGQMQACLTIFKAEKKFPEAAFFLNTVRLLEWSVAGLMAYLNFGIVGFSLGLMSVRIVGCFLMFALTVVLFGREYFLALMKPAYGKEVELLKSSIANFASSISLMMSVQGVVLILSVSWGGAAVAAFNVLRIMSRIIIQITSVISQAAWPEFSYAYAEGNSELIRKLLHRSRVIAFSLALLLSILIYFLSENILDLWVPDREIVVDRLTLGLLLAAAVVHSLWQVGWVYMMAIDKHIHFSYVLTLVVLLFAFCLYFLAGFEVTYYAAIGLLFMEIGALLFERYFVFKSMRNV